MAAGSGGTDGPTGVHSWVETLQPDLGAARAFYGSLFGWDFRVPDPAAGDRYAIAALGGRDVAGFGTLPDLGGPPVPAMWGTWIRVADVREAVQRVTAASGHVVFGPLQAPGGLRAVLADPTGAAFGVLDAGGPVARLVGEPGSWAMSSLHTPDPEAAAAFYGQVFGWRAEPVRPGGTLTVFRLAGHVAAAPDPALPEDAVGVMAGLPAGAGAPGVPPHWSVNFRVADTDDVARRATELGGRVLVPPTDTPGLRSALLVDPQGGVVPVNQSVPAA